MQLVIGNKNYSSWSLRAWLLPVWHGLAFEEVRIPLGEAQTAAEIGKYNKAGKVPVLLDNGLTVWDSLAILEYLSEKYLQGKGWPEDEILRAEARSCCAEMHSSFFFLREEMPMNCRATGRAVPHSEELERDIRRIDEIWASMRKKYSDRGEWLFGDFSIADCMFAPVVFRFRTYGVEVSTESHAYMANFLRHEPMREWLKDAEEEQEVIGVAEVGTTEITGR